MIQRREGTGHRLPSAIARSFHGNLLFDHGEFSFEELEAQDLPPGLGLESLGNGGMQRSGHFLE